MDLQEKVIVITGGGRGIGRAIALGCAGVGARVVIAARSQSDLDETSAQLRAQSSTPFLAVKCDVTSDADVKNLFAETHHHLGPTFGLVCASGIYGPIGPIETLDLKKWQEAIEINLTGTVRTIQGVLGAMKERREGRILLFSGGGQAAMANFSSYVSSKGAIWRLTETLAAELTGTNVYTNAIAPGAVNTKLLEDLLEAGPGVVGELMYQRSLKQKQDGGTPPDKAVALSLYLLSDKARGLSGKIISAQWDDYENISDPEAVTRTDLFTVRRIVTPEGGTRSQ